MKEAAEEEDQALKVHEIEKQQLDKEIRELVTKEKEKTSS